LLEHAVLLFFRGLFFGGHVGGCGSVAVAVFAVCFKVERRGGDVSFEGHDRSGRRSGLRRTRLAGFGVGGGWRGGGRRRRVILRLPATRRYAVVYGIYGTLRTGWLGVERGVGGEAAKEGC